MMATIKRQQKMLSTTALASFLLITSSTAVQANELQRVYEVLAARWWQWADATNAAGQGSGPVDCRQGQVGFVWFLAGSFGTPEERRCSTAIPGGVRLFFPLVNVEVSDASDEDDCAAAGLPGCSVEDKRRLADGIFSDQLDAELEEAFFGTGSYACQLTATVDGEPVEQQGVPIVRIQSPPFPLAGDLEAVADGFWVLLPPLPSGQHTIHFAGGVCATDAPPTEEALFKSDVSYTLRVQNGVRSARAR